MQRCIATYDPHVDASERWPHWWFHFVPLHGVTAKYSVKRRTFWFDAAFWAGREDEAIATAVAHLDFGHHHEPGEISVAQQGVGRYVAQVRLDREIDRDLV
ncbi:MAG: hypothetical protein ABWX96_21850 [Propionibacteriaceae bacterium]